MPAKEHRRFQKPHISWIRDYTIRYTSPSRGIYVMYILGFGGLYTTIQPRYRGFFFRPRSENPEGNTPCPRDFPDEDEKNRGRGGYIVVYSSTRPNTYNIYTTFSVLALKRNTFQFFKTMEHAAITKINDAVTMRQFSQFLTNAKLPPLWEGKIKSNVLVLVCFFFYHYQTVSS